MNKKSLVALVGAASLAACASGERRQSLKPAREIHYIGTGTAAVGSFGRYAPVAGPSSPVAGLPSGAARLAAALSGLYGTSPVTSENEPMLRDLWENTAGVSSGTRRVGVGYYYEGAGRAAEGYDGFAVGLTSNGTQPLFEIQLQDFVAVAGITSQQISQLMATRAPTVAELREYARKLERPFNPLPTTMRVSPAGVASLNKWYAANDARGRKIEIPPPSGVLHVCAYLLK